MTTSAASLTRAIVLLVVAVVGVVFVRGWIQVDPGQPFADGPVAVLGGAGGRVEAGVRPVESSSDPRLLVLSSSAVDLYRDAGGSCDEVDALCVMPEPETTAGEARLLARLAREEGWPRLTVVTSDTHAARARMHLERCVEVPVSVVAVASPWSLSKLQVAAREAGGTAWQWLTDRC